MFQKTKTVMIFLDASARMSLGSTVDNAFEHAIQAASGIASFYLDQGMRVGVYAYHFGEYILPDTGRKQASLITRSLIDIQIADDPAGKNENCLDEAVTYDKVQVAEGLYSTEMPGKPLCLQNDAFVHGSFTVVISSRGEVKIFAASSSSPRKSPFGIKIMTVMRMNPKTVVS